MEDKNLIDTILGRVLPWVAITVGTALILGSISAALDMISAPSSLLVILGVVLLTTSIYCGYVLSKFAKFVIINAWKGE